MNRKNVSRVLAALLAMLMVLSVCPVSVFAEGETADVTVTVVSAADSLPIKGASVSVPEGTPVLTGEDGTAVLPGLTVGQEYQVSVTADGYEAGSQTFTCAVGTPVTVKLSPAAADVNVTVTDQEGSPLSGVSLTLEGVEGSVTTDATGSAVLKSLTMGEDYKLTAALAYYNSGSLAFTCNDKTVAEGLTVKLTPYTKTSVKGVVICDNVPVSGVTVKLVMAEGETAKTATTGSDGTFSFTDVYKELVESLTVEDSDPYDSLVKNEILFGEDSSNTLELEKKTFKITTVLNGGGENCSVDVEPAEVPYGGTAKVTVTADPEKYVIYQLWVDKAADEKASGLGYYEFSLENVQGKHTVVVDFYEEGRIVTFLVDGEGRVYVEDEDGKTVEVEATNFPGLKVAAGADPNDSDKTQVTVTYKPATNYRVSAASVDGGKAEEFEDNDHVYSCASFTLDDGDLRKFELEIRLNQFKITFPEDGTVTGPEKVNYNWDATLKIEPPAEKYLSKLTVNGTDVTSAVSYNGEITYQIKQVQADQTVEAVYADITEAASGAVKLTTSGNTYHPDSTSIYYLGVDGKVTLEPTATGARISTSPNGPFSDTLVLDKDAAVGELYLLEGTTITKVTYRDSIKTIKDITAPDTPKSEVAVNKGKPGLEVTAVDNEDGSGIARVVYSMSEGLTREQVLGLNTVAKPTGNVGEYFVKFSFNTLGIFHFWAIDNVGNVSEFPQEVNVNTDDTAPELSYFEVDSKGYVTFDNVNYPLSTGITFSVKAVDNFPDNVESVTLKIGDLEKEMKRISPKSDIYQATVTPEEIEDAGEYTVSVSAKDRAPVPNTSDPVTLKVSGADDTEVDFILTIEKDPPVAAFEERFTQLPDGKWYTASDGFTFSMTITDTGSGINPKSIEYSNNASEKQKGYIVGTTYFAKNDEGILTEYATVPARKVEKVALEFTVNGASDELTAYDFVIKAEDNEGNARTVASDSVPGLKFSIDGTAPKIVKFDIGANKEQDAVTVVATEYGYFFNNAATIRVYASDTGSGVGSISFYKIRSGVENPEVEPVAPNPGAELVEEEGTGRWYAEFTVEDGFKGQIYAYAVDNAGNSNKNTDNEKNAHPEALTTTETQAQHKELTHVTVELPETKQTDEKGNPLYAGVVYEYDESGNLKLNEDGTPSATEQPVEVKVTVSDTFNGIQSVTYSVKLPESSVKTPESPEEAPESTEEAQGNSTILTHTLLYSAPDGDVPEGATVIPNTGEKFKDGNGIEWTVGREKNLVTTLSAIIPITKESNNLSVVVTMEDMADNITASDEQNGLNEQGERIPNSAVLSIDNTPPKIEISHLLVDTNASKEVPSEGTALSTEKEAPNFVGFNTEEYGKTGPYNLYAVPPQDKNNPQKTTTLRIKVTERNLGKLGTEEDKKAFLKNLAENAANVFQQLLPTSDIKEVTTGNLAKNLLVFGPYVDVEGERKDAQYPYSADTYYLIELRDCSETAKEGGTYQTAFTLTDLAGYQAKDGENFVIDSISPIITITFDNNDVRNGKYYNADRIATITVVERNFNNDENGDAIKGEASLDGRAMDFPTISGGWKDSGDYLTHTATVSFTTDGRYRNFTATYTDLAGHTASFQADEFHVDKTMPEIIIADIQDKSANNGTVAPSITYSDINLDLEEVEIALTGVNNGPVDYPTLKETIHNGEQVVYVDFEYVKSVDDVYTLFVKAEDLAGNTTTETIRFSCNRFGSVFDLSQIRDMLGKYNKEGRTLVITETNVDAIDFLRLRVTLTKNGVPVDLVLGKDFFIESLGSEGTWHQYVYRFLEGLFDDDGTYSIYIYSEDAAGNINENIDDLRDAQISFGIDKTSPIVTPIDFESGKQYAVESKTVTVEVKDNLLLDGVKIYLNGEEIPFQTDGDSYTFQIPMRNSKQNVRIVAVDSAGNEEELFVSDFLVTTNLFVRWYNNTPLFVGTLVLLALLVGLLIWLLLFLLRRKRKDEEAA